MKEIDEVILPEDFRYAETHEWAKIKDDKIIVGITDYAQDHLGDLTFVELPQVGDTYQKGDECGTLESTKAVSEIFMPVSGEILAVNSALLDSPGLVNSDPYGEGWLLELMPENTQDVEQLLTAEAYREMIRGIE